MSFPETRALALALLLAHSPALLAQDSEAPAAGSDLIELKTNFQKKMHEAITPAARLYFEELQKLERGFAATGRYEAAIAARDERLVVSAFLGKDSKPTTAATKDGTNAGTGSEPKPDPSEGLKFEDATADISEGAEFIDAGLALGVDGATASWQIGAAEPGGYEVVIEYSAKEDAEVQVKESFFRLTGELPATAGKTATTSLGTLKITSRSDAVSILRKGDGEIAGGLIIHSIRLISAKD